MDDGQQKNTAMSFLVNTTSLLLTFIWEDDIYIAIHINKHNRYTESWEKSSIPHGKNLNVPYWIKRSHGSTYLLKYGGFGILLNRHSDSNIVRQSQSPHVTTAKRLCLMPLPSNHLSCMPRATFRGTPVSTWVHAMKPA